MADQSTAQNAGQSAKEAHEGNTSHEILTLDILPNEIISSITLALAVDIHAPFLVPAYIERPSAKREEEDIYARRNLTSLCMVSKRIYSNAQKALYRNILIADAATLVFLYRTLLENPKLGTYVKRISFEELASNELPYGDVRDIFIFQSSPIDLGPLLSCAQHGLGQHWQLTAAAPGSRVARDKFAAEMILILQFRLLGRTQNLESLDLHVHPLEDLAPTYGRYGRADREAHAIVVTEVLHSLWEETSLCLSRLKCLQLIGAENSGFGSKSAFVVLMCRRFLALPKLEQLIWFNHTDGWFDLLPNRMLSGYYDDSKIATEAQYGSIRALKLEESSCFPRDLVALCSAFPHLESLSVNTDSLQCQLKTGMDDTPAELHGSHNPNSGMGANCLTDSLASLENLTTLNLDLHWACNVSRTLGPSGILSLAGLPNLQALALPFHFLLKKEPEGHYKVVSPASVLPHAMKKLRIVACVECLEFWISKNPSQALAIYQHQDAVLEFLDGLANLRAGSFPSLGQICYHESASDSCFQSNCRTSPVRRILTAEPCAFHFAAESDKARLRALSRGLLQSGVVFKKFGQSFSCSQF